MRFAEYELDLAQFELRRSGVRVRVQPKVLDLLIYLMRNRERVVPKGELLDAVWQGVAVSEMALTHAIKEARRAVRDDGNRQTVIRTVRGRGYRFVARVEEPDEEPISGATGEPFVGRHPILDTLGQEFAAACRGRPRLVFITGEPGIGKSRTAVEFAESLRAEGARVLVGRCIEGQGAPPHWPWTQIVRGALRRGLVDHKLLDSGSAAVLLQALPDLRAELVDAEPPPEPVSVSDEQARFCLSDALSRLLHGIARQRPLVLVLDDLHWADQSSLHLLDFLVREAEPAPILVLGTYRDAELARDPSRARLLSAVARSPGSHTLQLGGLEPDEVASLFETVTGRTLSPELAKSVQLRTGGNPFFLTQIAQLWSAGGADLERLDRELPIPQGLREAISRHLDVLTEASRDLLTRAAVIGREFELDVLARASGVSVDSALESLENGLETRVVRPVGDSWTRFEFAHALIPETLYEAMTAARRLRLHARVARALEELREGDPGRLAEIAHHFSQAAPLGHAERAIHFCVAAAKAATHQLAWEEAERHYTRALDVLPFATSDAARELELLLRLGEAEVRCGEVGRARQTFQRAAAVARELGDAAGLARAALGMAWEVVRQGVVGTDAVRVALLGEALGAVGPQESPLRVRLMAALDEALYFEDTAPEPSLSAEAVEMARRLDDSEALTFALNRRHMVLRRPDCLDERLNVSTELVKLTNLRPEPDLVFDAYGSQIHDALERGDILLVDEALETFERRAGEYKLPKYLWWASLYRAMRELLRGSFADAELHIGRAWEIGARVQGELAQLWHVSQMQSLRMDQGRSAEFLPRLREVAELFPIDVMRQNVALVEGLTGFTGPARRILDRLTEATLESVPRNITWGLSMTALSRMAEMTGDARAASAIYEQLLPFENQQVVIGMAIVHWGSVGHELGRLATVLERYDEAAAHFEAGLESERRLGARVREASTQVAYARVLLARGEDHARDEARARLKEGAALAGELGAFQHHQSAVAMLASLEK
jgi:DNA-binding winged helix-turn-helix (wHTH) protein/tetratricopeptide (TPR) repeat protein